MTVFPPWAQGKLEAGRLIARALIETTGSAVLHRTEHPAPLERAG